MIRILTINDIQENDLIEHRGKFYKVWKQAYDGYDMLLYDIRYEDVSEQEGFDFYMDVEYFVIDIVSEINSVYYKRDNDYICIYKNLQEYSHLYRW